MSNVCNKTNYFCFMYCLFIVSWINLETFIFKTIILLNLSLYFLIKFSTRKMMINITLILGQLIQSPYSFVSGMSWKEKRGLHHCSLTKLVMSVGCVLLFFYFQYLCQKPIIHIFSISPIDTSDISLC